MPLIKRVCVVVGLLVAFTAGFWCGSWSIHTVFRGDKNDPEVRDEFDRFQSLSEDVFEYIQSRDGWIPADAYRGLIDANVVPEYAYFIFGEKPIELFQQNTPCRINVEIARNVRAPFFYVGREDLEEVWVTYLDGTCKRESYSELAGTGHLGGFAEVQMRWRYTFHQKYGYPYWVSAAEKKDWCLKNRHKLKWDSMERAYVPVKE